MRTTSLLAAAVLAGAVPGLRADAPAPVPQDRGERMDRREDPSRTGRDRDRQRKQNQDRARKQQQRPSDAARTEDRAAADRRIELYRADDLLGTEVVNARGRTVADVADFALDRGSGRIHHVVLRDGGVLGIGGRLVAVPFASFGFDLRHDRLTLDATPEIVERARGRDAGRWLVAEDGAMREMIARRVEAESSPSGDDRRAAAAGSRVTVEGMVLDVRRVDRGDREIVDLEISTDASEGRDVRRIVLGPSWYVMGQSAVPIRGDRVRVRGWSKGGRVIAGELGTASGSMRLRDEDGRPRWRASSPGRSVEPSRIVMAGDLDGMPVRTADEDEGEIDGVLLEIRSGRVAMLLVDPNENLLGIADELRMVPWTVASVGDERVRLDAERAMVRRAVAAPDDPADLSTRAALGEAHRVFGTSIPDFEPRAFRSWRAAASMGGWSRQGRIARLVREGSTRTMTGTVRTLDAKSPVADDRRLTEASALAVRTDGERRIVVLGPAWFVQRQEMPFERDEEVTLTVTAIELDGRRFLVARSIEGADGRTLRFWPDGLPAWDAG